MTRIFKFLILRRVGGVWVVWHVAYPFTGDMRPPLDEEAIARFAG
jgi:hypothetical protein